MMPLLLLALPALAQPDAVAALAEAAPAVTVGPAGADPAALLTAALGEGPVGASTAVRLLLFLTGLSFLPAMVVVMTPFVRFVVVFALLRQALGLTQSPPNQVIVGLSLFLSILVLDPVIAEAWTNGLSPFLDGTLAPGPALEATLAPFRGYMLANTRREDMALLLEVGGIARPETLADIPFSAVASAFILSELQTAFVIAIYVYVPFLVIDLVVSSVLLGMGMMMLPPVMVSLPFKLLVFVLMDGWALLVRDLVAGVAR